MSTNHLMKACLAAVLALGLVACSSSDSGTDTSMPTEPPAPTPVAVTLPSDLPAEYEPAAGDMTIQPGSSDTSNGVVFSCASDGEACMVTVAADGTVSSTGGTVTAMLTQAVADLVASRDDAGHPSHPANGGEHGHHGCPDSGQRRERRLDRCRGKRRRDGGHRCASGGGCRDRAECRRSGQSSRLWSRPPVTPSARPRWPARSAMDAAADAEEEGQMRVQAKPCMRRWTGRLRAGPRLATSALLRQGFGLQSDGSALKINVATGAGSLTSDPDGSIGVTLDAGDSAGSLGSWAGTNYAHTSFVTKVMNEAVVYSNQSGADADVPQ